MSDLEPVDDTDLTPVTGATDTRPDTNALPTDGTPERADLDLIERDLRDVESSLARLADGTYFTAEVVTSGSDPAVTGSTSAGVED